MRLSGSSGKQVQPLVNFRGGVLNMDPFMPWRRKDKVVIVMGATGIGKSRLSIDLATRFPAEILNSDKMQVYEGLGIVTNKVAEEECRGVPHHFLGIVDSNADFTATDFRHHATRAVESIVRRDRLPIIAGGSNSFIKSLVDSERVDRMMVVSGLVDEVRRFFEPNEDYTRGLRRAIGVPEIKLCKRAGPNLGRAKMAQVFLG